MWNQVSHTTFCKCILCINAQLEEEVSHHLAQKAEKQFGNPERKEMLLEVLGRHFVEKYLSHVQRDPDVLVSHYITLMLKALLWFLLYFLKFSIYFRLALFIIQYRVFRYLRPPLHSQTRHRYIPELYIFMTLYQFQITMQVFMTISLLKCP